MNTIVEDSMGNIANGHVRYRDGRTRRIQVSMITPFGAQLCGHIEFNSSRNWSRFIYEAAYSGPALDPINLPTRNHSGACKVHEVDNKNNPQLLHRVFMDYMPGPWGQNILLGEFPYLREYSSVEKLHWLGTRAVGSLVFHVDDLEDEQPVNGAARLQEVRKRSVEVAMGRLSKVGNLEMDAGQGNTPRWILEGLAAFGGARPKCTFKDHRGGQWLAKFNLEGDPYNCARVEHATAELAKRAGIDVVQTRCIKVSGANDILLVKRYDRASERFSHKVSAFSLLSPQQAPHHSGGDYMMLFRLLEQLCARPFFEKQEMIRRMFFNVFVNNTDDHLKNFEFIYDYDMQSYELSPAYDLMIDIYPNARSTKILGDDKPKLDQEMLMRISQSFHEPVHSLMAIREEVALAITQWREIFKESGVNDRDIKRIARVLDSVKPHHASEYGA